MNIFVLCLNRHPLTCYFCNKSVYLSQVVNNYAIFYVVYLFSDTITSFTVVIFPLFYRHWIKTPTPSDFQVTTPSSSLVICWGSCSSLARYVPLLNHGTTVLVWSYSHGNLHSYSCNLKTQNFQTDLTASSLLP